MSSKVPLSQKSEGRNSIATDTVNPAGKEIRTASCKSPDLFTRSNEATWLTFELSRSSSASITNSDHYTLNTGRVSQYDELIRVYSDSINWDWRLLASLICQESRFRPHVVSSRGAYGLMQIMPVTARSFGVDIKSSPENNLRAGILYINWLYTIFDKRITNEHERLYFILASYNAGPGHVLDAMRLAGKNGMDPQKWNGNVAVWLLKKSEPEYYKDPVVRNGYFRGKESVKFVSEVLDRFAHYKSSIPEEKNHLF